MHSGRDARGTRIRLLFFTAMHLFVLVAGAGTYYGLDGWILERTRQARGAAARTLRWLVDLPLLGREYLTHAMAAFALIALFFLLTIPSRPTVRFQNVALDLAVLAGLISLGLFVAHRHGDRFAALAALLRIFVGFKFLHEIWTRTVPGVNALPGFAGSEAQASAFQLVIDNHWALFSWVTEHLIVANMGFWVIVFGAVQLAVGVALVLGYRTRAVGMAGLLFLGGLIALGMTRYAPFLFGLLIPVVALDGGRVLSFDSLHGSARGARLGLPIPAIAVRGLIVLAAINGLAAALTAVTVGIEPNAYVGSMTSMTTAFVAILSSLLAFVGWLQLHPEMDHSGEITRGRLVAALLVLALAAGAGELRAQEATAGPELEAAALERVYDLSLGCWIQPRYEFSQASPGENLSSFQLRRVRVDLQGHVFDERLTFRIMPELARTATLRDAWMDFAFSLGSRLRFGQFTVPFQWHRFVGPRRQHFAERGVPSETFGFPTGRDLGLMFHGQNPARTMGWNIGLFDGAGRNVAESNSAGNVASGRLSRAVLGTLPREEVDIARSPDPLLSVGLGVQGATRNEARAWDLGGSAAGNQRADWITGTADVHLRWQGLSLAADGYLRRVSPDDDLVDSYTGAGGMVSGGFTLVADRLDVVGRWSTLRLDRDDRDTGDRQWGLGVNIYHAGHDSKTRIQYLNDRTRTGGDAVHRLGVLLVEYHIQF